MKVIIHYHNNEEYEIAVIAEIKYAMIITHDQNTVTDGAKTYQFVEWHSKKDACPQCAFGIVPLQCLFPEMPPCLEETRADKKEGFFVLKINDNGLTD